MVTRSSTKENATFFKSFNLLFRNLKWFSSSSHSRLETEKRRKFKLMSDIRRFGLELSGYGLKYTTALGFLLVNMTNYIMRLSKTYEALAEYGNHNRKIEALLEIAKRQEMGRLTTVYDLQKITYRRSAYRSLDKLLKLELVKKNNKKYYALTDKGREIAQYINQFLSKLSRSVIFIIPSPKGVLEFSSDYSLSSGLKRCLHIISNRYHGGELQILVYVPSEFKKSIRPSVAGKDLGLDIVINVDLTENEIKATIPLVFERPFYVDVYGKRAKLCGLSIDTQTKIFKKDHLILQGEEAISRLFAYVEEKSKASELTLNLRKLKSKRVRLREVNRAELSIASHLMCVYKNYWTLHLTSAGISGIKIELFFHLKQPDVASLIQKILRRSRGAVGGEIKRMWVNKSTGMLHMQLRDGLVVKVPELTMSIIRNTMRKAKPLRSNDLNTLDQDQT